MFTPPPSPFPPTPEIRILPDESEHQVSQKNPPHPTPAPPTATQRLKRRIGRRTKWTAIMAPIALILVTLSTRYITHPAAFDLFYHDQDMDWQSLASRAADWHLHKRHPQGSTVTFVSEVSSPTSTDVANTAVPSVQVVPTIPTDPVLPTPFPQAWDSDIGQSYSTQSCFDFFRNMTNTTPFRSCRPLSLLMQNSNAFIEAQRNLSLMNAVLWGTCNTTLDHEECVSNMLWFASALQEACAQDLEDNNAIAKEALIGLQAYPLVYESGCLSDPTTNTYCYINALQNANPSDLYVYQLPLGLSLPNSSTPTCSACTKSLMGRFVEALENSNTPGNYDALLETYDKAAELAASSCGTDYARVTLALNAALPSHATVLSLRLLGMVLAISWTLS